MKICRLILVVLSVLGLWSCGGGDLSDGNGLGPNDSDDNTNTEPNDAGDDDTNTGPNDNGSNSDGGSDPCGNAIGNGNEIISGPSETVPPIDNDSVFRALAVDPNDPDVVFFGTERNGFLKSTDGGATWSRKRVGLRHMPAPEMYSEVWHVAFDPFDSAVLYAAVTGGPGLVTDAADNAGVYKSTGGGETWSRSNCGLVNSKAAYIAVSPSDSNIVLAAIQGEQGTGDNQAMFFEGGIYRSTDGGANWVLSDMPSGTVNDRIWIIRVRGNPAHYYTFAFRFASDWPVFPSIGFLKSTDEGSTWAAFAPSLKDLPITHFDVSSDGQVLYAMEQDAYRLHYSGDGGGTWSIVEPLPQPQGPVAISPVDSLTVVYGALNQLARTTDGMSTTTVVATDDNKFEWIEIAPSDPDVIYAGTTGYTLYRSADGGATFTKMSNGREFINSNP